jgi:hypothetical protein
MLQQCTQPERNHCYIYARQALPYDASHFIFYLFTFLFLYGVFNNTEYTAPNSIPFNSNAETVTDK